MAKLKGWRKIAGAMWGRPDDKSVFDIALELRERAGAMKSGDDREFAKSRKAIASMPRRLLRPSMRFSSWLAGDRNRDIKALGVKPSTFGSAMVTSVGMFGIQQGFAP